MKKLRILVLMHRDLIPPDSLEGYSDKEIVQWKTEYDVVTTLREMGHEVKPVGVHDDLSVIREEISDWKPQIAFNLLEEFHGNSLFDYHVVSYLELMQQPYTGCNPRGLLLAHDKALAKQIFTYHRIRTPRFAVFPIDRKIKFPRRLQFPVIVKSLFEEGSYGLARTSVVDSEEKFLERVSYLHEQLGTPAIAENYIDGRELYVGVIGNQRLQVLPVLELEFGSLDERLPRIATEKVKWDWSYQKKHGIDLKPADLTPDLRRRIVNLAKRTYRALSLSGYARLDLRMTPDDRFYVLEANANPDVAYGEELSTAGEAAGLEYEALLHKLINLGLRYRPERRLV